MRIVDDPRVARTNERLAMVAGDPLLQPTISTPAGKPPWRLTSIGFVAFFGGVIASTVISLVNAGRLGTPSVRPAIALWGLLGLVATGVASVLVLRPDADGGSVVFRLSAVLVYLLQARLMRPGDFGNQLRGAEYSSLWLPGIGAVVGFGLLEASVLAVLVTVFE
jgi:hypothetical protein